MRNFQIFSIILALIVVIMVGQVVYTDYVPDWFSDSNKTVKTDVLNKLGSDLGEDFTYDYFSDESLGNTSGSTVEVLPTESVLALPKFEETTIEVGLNQGVENFSSVSENDSDLVDFEDIGVKTLPINPYLREEQLRSAGFLTAFFEEEKNDSMLYKTIYVGDMEDVIMRRFVIKDEALLYAKVYIFSPDAGKTISSIYDTLKQKSALNANSSINETNQFGKASFYMNDTLRPDTAFLSVRYNSLVYCFSYPKIYHNQVSNLIKLIALER